MEKKEKPADYIEYLSLGGEIAAALFLPIIIGYWLDGYFGSSPWILLVGCAIGIINIFVMIFRLNKRLS